MPSDSAGRRLRRRPSLRVGIDIGGTFTDLVAATADGIVVHKVSSTPQDPSMAFAAALERIDGEIDEVRHGTTVATNAVLTRTGAKLAFVTTEGFRHLLHLARQSRPSLYDLHVAVPAPLVDIDRCFGVQERVGPHGEEVLPISEDGLGDVIEQLGDVDGVVVTLLHSYADPAHERRIGEAISQARPDIGVSLSSDVLSEFREYERVSTTALNAYVQPAVARYLRRVEERTPARVGVMWSGGGVRSIAQTIDKPVHTMYSGPAAGVLGAAWAARACGFEDVVTIDMGGTSADVALVEKGKAAIAQESAIDGLPFATPCLDVISVGAGGGSIAWVDEGGALRVGPRSAGAEPGPACYGRGGVEATVTDAQVVLGYLGDEGLAGGELTLDRDAAAGALDMLGAAAHLPRDEAAEGVLRVVRATMTRAIRSISVERGRDVRDYALVAFGGAGPLHATALARELGMRKVIVPPAPGAMAALGLLVASSRADAALSRPTIAERARDVELRSIMHELTEQVLAEIREEGVEFIDADIELSVDCRYVGQSHELRVALGKPSFVPLAQAFHNAHRDRYGFDRPDVAVEAVTFRAAAIGPAGQVTTSAPETGDRRSIGVRTIGGDDVALYRRAALRSDARIDGPAILVELDSTTYLDDGSSAVVHSSGALVVDVR